MRERHAVALFVAVVVLGACSGDDGERSADPPGGEPPSSVSASAAAVPAAETTLRPATTDPPTTGLPTADPPTTSRPTTSRPTTTVSTAPAASPASTFSTTTSSTTTTTPEPSTTTTTTTAPVEEPKGCVVRIRPGDSLSAIADRIAGKAVTVESLQTENGITDADTISAGDALDVCVGNRIDDITGERRVPPTTVPVDAGVAAQQQKINELLTGYGMPALAVDGDSGRLTEQQLCAVRVALGLPISRDDMAPGSGEEKALMSAESLPIPSTAPTAANRWALIDQTCQVMFVGEGGDRLVYVFPTSTGERGHETRDQNGSRVFRYDPASENGGWHNSTLYPVPGDNPLNGNMYKPLYFDNGQAIHGAGNVPPEPASKGCARLPVASQEALLGWLGLGDVQEPVWDQGRIDFTVTVQGDF